MRYLPLTDTDRQDMLGAIGVESLDALFRDVPASAYQTAPLADLPDHQSELAVERRFARYAGENLAPSQAPSFLGAGAYRHHVPASVDYIIQRGEFLTSYTPYQPEIAQGTLQYLFEFQTQVALLTGMEVANASMYDGATALAEAVLMANRVTKRRRAVIAGNVHPHYAETCRTFARFNGFTLDRLDPVLNGQETPAAALGDDVSCVVVQSPDIFGHIHDVTALAEQVHAAGALLIVVVTEVVSLGLLPPPGEMGADIVVGEGQSIGNAPSFGGPHLGLFATRQKYVRQMPGRLAGQTVDAEGKRGFVLTLNTREQHIRREKATSNICTNSGLCALAFTVHMTLLGDAGLKRLALLNHERAGDLADRIEAAVPGARVETPAFFNEIAVTLPRPAAPIVEQLAERDGVLAGVPASRLYAGRPELETVLLLAATETVEDADIDTLVAGLARACA